MVVGFTTIYAFSIYNNNTTIPFFCTIAVTFQKVNNPSKISPKNDRRQNVVVIEFWLYLVVLESVSLANDIFHVVRIPEQMVQYRIMHF